MAETTDVCRLTRRALLKIGALAGGGLLLGIRLHAYAEPLSDAPADLAHHAWIRIQGDGRISLSLARSEMGQGVMTALPMLRADVLEVGLDQVEIEPAPVDPAYINQLLGEQATGESTSIREAWMGLREAGAVVRTLLIQAAALTWNVPEAECQARRGRVQHTDGVRTLTYAELAATAAQLPLPAQVALKAPADSTPPSNAVRCPIPVCEAGAVTLPGRCQAWSRSCRCAGALRWSRRRAGPRCKAAVGWSSTAARPPMPWSVRIASVIACALV